MAVNVVTGRLSKISSTITAINNKNSYFSIPAPLLQPAGVTSSSFCLINSRLRRLIEAHQLSEPNTAAPSLMAAGLQSSHFLCCQIEEKFSLLSPVSQSVFLVALFPFFFFRLRGSRSCTAGTSDEPERKIKQQHELPPTTFHCWVRLQSPTEETQQTA